MRRVGHVVAGVLCGALLAGCGGAPEASSPPSPASPSESETAAPKPPVLSGSENAPTKTGARAFVGGYIRALNFATATGDLTAVRALDDGTCQSCDSTLAAIAAIYDAGGGIEGGEWTPTVIDQIKRTDGWVVDVRLEFAPQQVARNANAEPEQFDGGEGLASFIIRDVRGDWRVDEWTRAD